MSDTDSIKTDRSQPDLQQKYDKLSKEFAKVRLQLNVLKNAYTSNFSKLGHRSIDSLDQLENDSMSTSSLISNDDSNCKSNTFNSKAKRLERGMKYNDLQLLKQDINVLNNNICRVLDCTKSNSFDYNVIMSEIENCKNVQNSSSNFCDVINNELSNLKSSVITCMYNLLYHKLESRTYMKTVDCRLVYPKHYCLDKNHKSDENRLQNIFMASIINFYLTFIINVHEVLIYLLKEINPDASNALQESLKPLTTNRLHSSILENILMYCQGLQNIKLDSQYIIMENILLFISNKYIEFVNCVKDSMKSDNIIQIDKSFFRKNIISFMSLKFPIEELVESGKYFDSSSINKNLNVVFEFIHTVLNVINVFEFEDFYRNSQLGLHWHKKNFLSHSSGQVKEQLYSLSITQNIQDNINHLYNDELNEKINQEITSEHEKISKINDYKLLYKEQAMIPLNEDCKQSISTEAFVLEVHQLGKCESNLNLSDSLLLREMELKSYFENKIESLMSTNKKLSSQNQFYAKEIIALRTQLDHSSLVHNTLELKIQESLEHIKNLKEEFQLTSTNYETQLRAMSEHLVSLNKTEELEQRYINDLNRQLKPKKDKKK